AGAYRGSWMADHAVRYGMTVLGAWRRPRIVALNFLRATLPTTLTRNADFPRKEPPMFIQTEPTPNPATLKFLPGRAVLAHGTLDMRDKVAAAQSPLAERLFDIAGVSGVFFGSDFIAVTKADNEWQQL